jgi:hypothetical protein
VKPETATLALDVQLTENSSLAAIAAAGLPIESYKSGLPATDHVVAAAWVREDWAKAMPAVKTLLRPLMDILTAGATEEARKGVDQVWAMYDQWATVLGSDLALEMEPAAAGQGMFRMVEVFAVNDPAQYRQLMAKMMTASNDLMKAMMGQMGAMPGGPAMKMDIQYKENAETVEGLPVDVVRMKFVVEPPPGAPPEAAAQMKTMMDAIYGPDGMTMRIALVDKLGVVAMGGPEVMAHAVRAARGQEPDLSADPKVAAAVARLPGGACAAGVLSLPNYVYMAMSMVDRMMSQSLPPDVRAAAQTELPPLEAPPQADLVAGAAKVAGRTVHVDLVVPQSEVQGAISIGKKAGKRMEWYMKKQMEQMQKQQGQPGAAPGAAPPASGPEFGAPAPKM